MVVIDLMLTGYRSIDVINNVSGTLPGVKVLALSPSDPPHERILLAMQAGSLGYITRDAEAAEIKKAIHQVYEGNPWLPVQDTYEVLQEAAPELAVSAEERRDRLTQIVLGIIPLTGIIAAITALLWREYWGKIGVRVVDLGIDPTTRMIDVLVFILMLVGMFGPLMFIDTWLKGLGNWLAEKTAFTNTVAKVRKVRLFKLPVGRLLFNHLMAWVLMALIILSIGILLHAYAQLILIMIIGPLVGVLLLVNILSMEDQLPNMFTISNLGNRRAVAVISVFLLGFLFVLGAEVLIREPDLRTNGMHGILAQSPGVHGPTGDSIRPG